MEFRRNLFGIFFFDKNFRIFGSMEWESISIMDYKAEGTCLGSTTKLKRFNPANLLPIFDDNYVTYEGSLTYPGCYETVTWVVIFYKILLGLKSILMLLLTEKHIRLNKNILINDASCKIDIFYYVSRDIDMRLFLM